MDAESLHLVVATGGTGGHFYPSMAVAREFRRRGGRVTMLVAGHHASEHLRLAQANDLPAQAMTAFRLPNNPLDAIAFPWHFWQTWRHACRALAGLAPDVVLGMGSFASVPVGLGAVSGRRPLVLHEGNSVVGRANRFLSRWARRMAVSLPLAPGQRVRCPTVRTGMPLRESLLAAAAEGHLPPGYVGGLGLAPDLPVLLVFGGSQGAQFLNEAMAGAVAALAPADRRFQAIHLTGARANDSLVAAYAGAGVRAVVKERDEHIENAYLAASLVLSRSGASTISELAVFGKPAVLVPLPTAADDHQTANAAAVAAAGGGRLLHQRDATAPVVAGLLADWVRNPATWAAMGQNMRALACPAATPAIVELLLEASGDTRPTAEG